MWPLLLECVSINMFSVRLLHLKYYVENFKEQENVYKIKVLCKL